MGRKESSERRKIINSVLLHNQGILDEITSDVFCISDRIREIDDGYFIVRNKMKKRFEVHHIESYPSTYQFTVPFDELDARTLQHTERTAKRNSDILIRQMEEHNDKIKADSEHDFHNYVEAVALDTARDLRRAID